MPCSNDWENSNEISREEQACKNVTETRHWCQLTVRWFTDFWSTKENIEFWFKVNNDWFKGQYVIKMGIPSRLNQQAFFAIAKTWYSLSQKIPCFFWTVYILYRIYIIDLDTYWR